MRFIITSTDGFLWLACLLLVNVKAFFLSSSPSQNTRHHSSITITSTSSSSSSSPSTIPRIDARDLSYQDFVELYDAQHPIILTHAFQQADGTRRIGDEAFADTIFDSYENIECAYQIKITNKATATASNRRKGKGKAGSKASSNTKTLFYIAKLHEIIDGMAIESHHYSAWYLLNEGLLDQADDALKEPLILPPRLFGKDYFDLYFPSAVQPKKHCLIIGGEGSRSFLHADPYEWSGVNYLFEGKKLWTFLPPSIPDEVLRAERVIPEAWDEEEAEGAASSSSSTFYNVSAGWKSAYDLYHTPPHITPDIKINPPAALRQGIEAIPTTSTTRSSQGGEGLNRLMLTVLQEEGDLIVIPPKWWHQVYHLEPSLCLAWQYCNKANLRHVLRHMLSWTAGGKGDEEEYLKADGWVDEIYREVDRQDGDDAWARRCIEKTLEKAMILRHGEVKGKKLWERMVRKLTS